MSKFGFRLANLVAKRLATGWLLSFEYCGGDSVWEYELNMQREMRILGAEKLPWWSGAWQRGESMTAAKPSLILKFDVDASLESEELVDELKRTYSYIAPVKVAFHEASEPALSIVGLNVIAHTPYWGADGDEYWGQVMLPWLERIFKKLNKTLVAHCGIRAKEGAADLAFAEAIVVFGTNGEVRLPLATNGSLPQDALDCVTAARSKE